MSGPNVVRFHGFALDQSRRTLSGGGRDVPLTRKAFDLLTVLIDAAPRVVPKDELHQRVWAGTFVTDATIAGVIKELRRALGDHRRDDRLIRTTHGVGYAFAGTVQAVGRGDAEMRHCLVWGARRLMLAEGANDIGRDPRATIWLDSNQVSRRHARIVIAGDAATIEDLGSKNRTQLNERLVTSRTTLADGDCIQIGSTVLLFRVADTLASTETATGPADSLA